MKRRQLIQMPMAFLSTIATFPNLPAFSEAQSIPWKEGYTIPEKELLGIDRPKNLTGDNFNLRPDAAQAFVAMRRDAEKAGIKMYSQSSYRSFAHQKRIWNRKYDIFSKSKSPSNAIQKIIEYSSLPGSSRHHWGTDLDIIDRTPKKQPPAVLHTPNYLKGGAYETLYDWLLANANRYGFYESYTDDPDRPGFAYEPWHWSYAPLAIPLLQQYASISLAKALPLKELHGAKHLTAEFLIDYAIQWGLGINPILKQS